MECGTLWIYAACMHYTPWCHHHKANNTVVLIYLFTYLLPLALVSQICNCYSYYMLLMLFHTYFVSYLIKIDNIHIYDRAI